MSLFPSDAPKFSSSMNATRKHGKSYLLSTRRKLYTFTIRAEHEEKSEKGNVAKRFTVEHEEKSEKGNVAKRFTVDGSMFLRKEIALLRKVVEESACYACIFVVETKRRTTRFKSKKSSKQ